jgi:hypothetical protein
LSRVLEIFRIDYFVREKSEMLPDTFELRGVPDSGQKFLPDGANQSYAILADELGEFYCQGALCDIQAGPGTPKRERPDVGVDQNEH